MTKRFDIDLYTSKRHCMHCSSEEDAITFLRYLHSIGRTWITGESYEKRDNLYSEYGDKTCYYFNTGRYGSVNGGTGDQIVLEFSEFDWDFIDGLHESEDDKRVLDSFINTFLVKN